MDSKEIKRRVVKGFAWEGGTKFIVQLVAWGTTIIVARILLPSDYGLMAVSGVFVQLLAVLTSCGLSEGLVNKTTVTERQYDGIFWVNVLMGLCMYGLLFAVAPYIAQLYKMEMLTPILRTAGVALLFASLKLVPLSLALREMNFKYRSIVEMVANLTMSATVVSLAIAGFGVWSLVWAYLARHIVEVVAYLPLLKRMPHIRIKLNEIKSIFTFGIKVTASKMLEFLMLRSDIMIIGLFLSQKSLGFYSMAFQFATIPMDKFGTVFNKITFPTLSRVKHDTQQSKALFLDLHRYLLTIAFPILIGLILVAEDAVIILLTEKWKAIIPLLQVLCVANLFRVSGMLVPTILAGRGNVNRVLRFHILSAIVVPIAFLIGVQWGMIGVVYAWIAAYVPLYVYLIYYITQELDMRISELISSVQSPLIASSVMFIFVKGFSLYAVDMTMHLRLILCVALGVVAYLGVFALFYREELGQVKRGLTMLRARS